MSLLACTTKRDLKETVHVRLSHTHTCMHTHIRTSCSSIFMHVPLLFLHYHQQSKLYAQECASSEYGQENCSISSNSHLLNLLSWALYFSCNSFFLCFSPTPPAPGAGLSPWCSVKTKAHAEALHIWGHLCCNHAYLLLN